MKIVLSIVAMVSLTVLANLMIKVGAIVNVNRHDLAFPLSWQTCAGVLMFGFALLIYARILQVLPLNVASSLAAGQFIGVIVMSAIALSEPIPPVRWLGIGLIAFGILIVGMTTETTP